MKYIAIFDDVNLQNFRLDDDGLTLVMRDKIGAERGVRLKPLIKTMITNEDGESVYISEGHIKALQDYENKEMMRDSYRRIIETIDEFTERIGGKE